MNLLSPILGITDSILKRVFPDPVERQKAEAELLKMQQSGELEELQIRLSAIIAEAKSSDPYTSRARPSFLYVIYILILACVPMGGLYAFQPDIADRIIQGMTLWLNGIPGELYALFTAGYLGYAGARSYDKKKVIEAGRVK